VISRPPWPDLALAAFIAVVLLGSLVFVAVRFWP
jgi:hypothetical protein